MSFGQMSAFWLCVLPVLDNQKTNQPKCPPPAGTYTKPDHCPNKKSLQQQTRLPEGNRVAETKLILNAYLGRFLTSMMCFSRNLSPNIHNLIIIQNLKSSLCQNTLFFGVNHGRKYANQQFDLQSIFALKTAQICRKSALELHIARFDPSDLAHNLAEEE